MNAEEKSLEDFCQRLGYRFGDMQLLRQALTHRSFANEAGGLGQGYQGERLEFLGDAVLQLVISDWLLKSDPLLDEGALTQLRAALVNERSLAEVARRLGLGEFILLGKGEEASGGRDRNSLLSDSFEAVCGAMFLDGGLSAARDFIVRALREAFHQLSGETEIIDPKSRLQQLLQKAGEGLPEYRVVERHGPDHHRVYRVRVSCAGGKYTAEGEGSSKKSAERQAACKVLEIINGKTQP